MPELSDESCVDRALDPSTAPDQSDDTIRYRNICSADLSIITDLHEKILQSNCVLLRISADGEQLRNRIR
jgi:hypothetical protein